MLIVSRLSIAKVLALSCLALVGMFGEARNQPAPTPPQAVPFQVQPSAPQPQTPAAQTPQPDPAQTQPAGPQPQPTQTLSELQKLQLEVSAQKEAQETIKKYLEIIAATIVIVSVFGILLQIISFRIDARNRSYSQQESARQATREEGLNNQLLRVLEFASNAGSEAQRKIASLEEGGIKRAGETLQLINNLLQITERAAAKAAGAQFDFLSRSIASFDSDCQKLITEAKASDERDIVAKREYSERVRVLTKQIESLDNQITNYNESVPRQLDGAYGRDQQSGESSGLPAATWSRLSLTAPCLFIRGLNNHLDQNFDAAINDWKMALEARGASSVKVDVNYWIGYVSNTLGRFDDATSYLKDAASVAPDQRKPELIRLEIETRFFALDLVEVPKSLLDEGRRYFDTLSVDRVSRRTISTFATTMGNISAIQSIRAAVAKGDDFAFPEESNQWYDTALGVEARSRWARFGKCQNLVIAGRQLNMTERKEVEDVIESVNREFQNRVEHRSKVLSKMTEYICILMLGIDDKNERRLSTIGGLIEHLTSDVTARTIYSQFRKQNVTKQTFLDEFHFLQKSMDLREAFRVSNTHRTATH